MLEYVKAQGCRWYDLNGINPVKNPGGYQFKTQLAGANGRDVQFIGQYDCYPNLVTKWIVNGGQRLTAAFPLIRRMGRSGAGRARS